MRLSRLPALLAAAALLGGGVACAATIEGTGAPAAGVATAGPTLTGAPTGMPTATVPTATGPSETSVSPTPTPAPIPTTDPVMVKRRLLCVLERASIASINNQFNRTKDRAVQIRVLRTGATTIKGHLSRSGLPGNDRVRKPGQNVLDQLNRLVTDASGGGTPSTAPYNAATQGFQRACNALP